ncbi:hypothetical protein PENOC_100440 [Penicillium occitanis (nom. inval.)]|nr:hypothetical protein PENOC_100440 [Penicillium occitanis (nom. inval.)]
MCTDYECQHEAIPASTVLGSYPLRARAPVGKRIARLDKNRIANFYTPGQWEKVNLLSVLSEAVYSGEPHVKLSVWDAPGLTRPSFAEASASSNLYQDTKVGDKFGPSWSTHWFKVLLTIPLEVLAKSNIELHWDCGNEATVWTEDGKPLQGLTGRGERVEWIIPDSFKDGKEHLIYIEMACNGMFGNGPGRPIFKNNAGGDSIQPPDPDKYFPLSKAEIVIVDFQARMLYMDIIAIYDAAMEFPEDSWQQHKALSVATKIINIFQANDRNSIHECRQIAQEFLGPNINSTEVYQQGIAKDIDVFAIGHCHIDTCWLWPWAETKRKVARSWLNQCDLMERYPELRFACSQAQQFKWLKEEYPHAWNCVKAKVEEGKFHPIGGCWVEHDTNIPNGESLVRQFLYGQRFFESNFGFRSTTLWLPDTFGFAAQLPQLSRQAGMNRFHTQKICFNNINEFPHTTFNWVALDGSQVISHMPPVRTYTAEGTIADVKRSVAKHLSMDQDHTSLMAFGKGDGGGGPTWQHLERLRRCRGVADTVGLLPKVHVGKSVDQFFDGLEKKADSLVTWHGELYFELHRGVYTTQSKSKRSNRKSEFLLRDLELLATFASVADPTYRYPKKEIDDMWEDKVYDQAFTTGSILLNQAYGALGLESVQGNGHTASHILALNTLPWSRNEIVQLSEKEFAAASGNSNTLSLEKLNVAEIKPAVSIQETSKDVFQLQNDQLSVTVEMGRITSLYDRQADREIITRGAKANQFVIFDDKPVYWQAWDVEVYHLETRQELPTDTTRIAENSSHRVSVVTEIRISDTSLIKSTISLSAAFSGQPSYVECSADVDWHETMRFLKVEFPVDIRNTEAAYETAYGIIKRPTHYNTSWDMAKFEVCSHKFADLSEHNYGVSIINDSKYGFATVGNIMRLSLLRSPKAPDDTADMGRHHIRWAILPHRGGLNADTVRTAYAFNNPLRLVVSKTDQHALSGGFPISLEGDKGLILDTIKRGEDDEDIIREDNMPVRKGKSVIIRVYESLGGRARGSVVTNWSVSNVYKTNLLEDDEEEIGFSDGQFKIQLGPFQVGTYRLSLE